MSVFVTKELHDSHIMAYKGVGRREYDASGQPEGYASCMSGCSRGAYHADTFVKTKACACPRGSAGGVVVDVESGFGSKG
jgi:hypothetical protein